MARIVAIGAPLNDDNGPNSGHVQNLYQIGMVHLPTSDGLQIGKIDHQWRSIIFNSLVANQLH